MAKKQVVIVGGGLAGLTAAKRLVEAGGFAVTVLEKRARLGGKWAAWQDDEGDWLESGLHVLFGAYEEIFALMRDLGTYDAILWKEHRMIFTLAERARYDLRFAPLPGWLATVPSLLLNRSFSLAQKWSLVRAGLPLTLGGAEYLERADDLSYAEWHAVNGIHDRLLQKLFLPVSLATKFVPPDQVSAKLVIEVSRLLMGRFQNSRIGFLRGSPERYVMGPLAEWVTARGGTIRREARVLRIETGARAEAEAIILAGPDGEERLPCDYLITALPIHNLQALIPPTWRALRYFDGLLRLDAAPVITVHLWLDKVVAGLDHLLFTPDGIFPVYADLALTSPDYRNERTSGSRFQFVLAPAADLMACSDEELVTRTLADLRRLFPQEAAQVNVLKQAIIRIPHSVYWPRPGSDRLRVSQESPLHNVFLAGGYTLQKFYDSLEGAVRSGNRAADALLAHDTNRPWKHKM